MLRSFTIVIFLLLIISGFSACCKKRVYCDSGTLKIAFSGFPRNEIKNIYIKRYKIEDSLRGKALDSATFIYTGNTPSIPNQRDTLYLSDYTSNNGMSSNITWGNDWEIRISALERVYRFTQITDEGHRYDMAKCSDNDTRCTNELNYFLVNGQGINGNTLFIRK